MTDTWLLVIMSLAIDITSFRHAEANREFKSSITSQARGASVSEDLVSIEDTSRFLSCADMRSFLPNATLLWDLLGRIWH